MLPLDQISWVGDEQVLDLGCGRGLLLIEAAKRLKAGSATGIDLWLTSPPERYDLYQILIKSRLLKSGIKTPIFPRGLGHSRGWRRFVMLVRGSIFLGFLLPLSVSVSACRFRTSKSSEVRVSHDATAAPTLNIKTIDAADVENLTSQMLASLNPYKVRINRDLVSPSDARVICALTTSVDQTYICMFNDIAFMNFAINRASDMIEGDGSIPPDTTAFIMPNKLHWTQLAYRNLQTLGHDLTGPDLQRFDQAFTAQRDALRPSADNPEVDKYRDRAKIEADFWTYFIRPTLVKAPHMVLLVVYADNGVQSNLDHELMHAQFFQRPDMQKIVDDFYAMQVTDLHKDRVVNLLTGDEYLVKPQSGDTDAVAAAKHFLLINEFQAYLLEYGAEGDTLAQLVPYYQANLRTKLTDAHIPLASPPPSTLGPNNAGDDSVGKQCGQAARPTSGEHRSDAGTSCTE